MDSIFNLKNRVAVVTGGYGYLGQEMSKTLQNYGAKVYVAGKDKEKFWSTFNKHENIKFIELDLSKNESIKNVF